MSQMIIIHSTPAVAFVQGAIPEYVMDAGITLPRLVQLLPLRRPLSMPGLYPAEISNATAEIDNADGAISRLWEVPPVRIPASIVQDHTTVMRGVITRIRMGVTVTLDIDAGIRAPISDTMPLRTSIMWGSFLDVRAIPWVYGRVTLTPVAYDATMRLFVLADHVIQGIDAVKVDGAPVKAWALHHAEDSTGQTCAFIELAAPLEKGQTLAVSLRGKMHPQSGALLTAPADVLHDLIVNMLGIPLALDALDKLRSDGVEIELGGVFNDPALSVKEAIDRVVQSFGGAWSFGARDVVIFDPFGDDADQPTSILPSPQTAVDMALESSHSQLASVLRITYDHDDATGAPRRALQIEAPEAINEYGRIEREWSAPWLKSPRQAERLARRLLGHLARPQWHATWQDTTQPPPSPGDFVDLSNHPYAALQGRHRLLVADIDPASGMTQCKIIAPIGDVPRMELKALSTAFEPQNNSVEAIYKNGIATFTVRNQLGEPLQGASVTLNEKITRITDSAGRVSFQTPRGKVRLTIRAQGYADITTEVEL